MLAFFRKTVYQELTLPAILRIDGYLAVLLLTTISDNDTEQSKRSTAQQKNSGGFGNGLDVSALSRDVEVEAYASI